MCFQLNKEEVFFSVLIEAIGVGFGVLLSTVLSGRTFELRNHEEFSWEQRFEKGLEKRNSILVSVSYFICIPHVMEHGFLAFIVFYMGQQCLFTHAVPVSVGKAA